MPEINETAPVKRNRSYRPRQQNGSTKDTNSTPVSNDNVRNSRPRFSRPRKPQNNEIQGNAKANSQSKQSPQVSDVKPLSIKNLNVKGQDNRYSTRNQSNGNQPNRGGANRNQNNRNQNNRNQTNRAQSPRAQANGSQQNGAQKPSNKAKPFNLNGKKPLRVIPLGGLCEIGKNMTALEYGNDIIIIDVGMAFAEENMPGVDAVIQDYTYIIENQSKLRGIFLTHGHEDHIGSLPYFLRDIKCPIYGGKLTVELVRHKLADKNVSLAGISLQACKNGDIVKAGNSFYVEFIRVNHSIADSYALGIRTPVGSIVHSGDFKVDFTPINGKPIDLQRFGEYGKEGVLLFMCESTNIEIDGFSPSEMQVGESFQRIFQKTTGRIIVATFSSHVHRMQQIFTAAEKYNRHVCLSGRSMINVFGVANSLGYIDMKPDTLIDIMDIDNYDPDEIVILTTGSQAEPMSALSRMAFASHKSVEIQEGDTVIISAHPIPGNEKPIYRVINELFKKGAHVIYESLADVHVSGHAYKRELMLLHSLLKPKFFVPVHGEYRMLFKHAELAKSLGTLDENIFIMNNGDVLEVGENCARINGHVPAAPVLIDGSGMGDMSNRVLTDRRLLGEDGCVSIAITIDEKTGELACSPIVKSVGFVFEDEADGIQKECALKIMNLLSPMKRKDSSIESIVESRQFKETIRNMLFDKSKRRPLIITSVSIVGNK